MQKLKHNKLPIAIGTLSVITFLTIIYAAFTGQMQINGISNIRDSAWDIHIVESGQLEPSNTLSSSAKVLTKPMVSGLSISDFDVSLTTPGDYIEYTFHIVNEGDYDATLTDLDKDGVTCTANGSTSDPEAVKVCDKLEYTLKYAGGADVSEGDTLLSKQTQTMVLKIKYQEFNDPTLLPTTNVSISGLGIDIEYSQSGSAKVNSDGTTPYNPYPIGTEVTLLNEKYNVIGVGSDYVTLLKQEPLTYAEMTENNYGQGYINRHTDSSVGQVYNKHGYGVLAYYSSPTCGYATPGGSLDISGCESEGATNYNNSDIKHVIDDWAVSKFTNGEIKTVDGYGARLATKEELQPIGWPNCTSTYCSREIDTPSWLYNPNYLCWTMSQAYDFASIVWDVDGNGGLGKYYVYYEGGAVRPVINIYKSAITN